MCPLTRVDVSSEKFFHNWFFNVSVDAAIFLGFDSGCRVIFASDDKNEGVKVAGNTHTELVGSWWWIGKHAINKMLDERDNARQNVSQKKTFSRTETIEKVFRKRFEVSSVYEAVNFLHDSYKYDVTKFAEQLAREHSEDPLVRDVFYDAGVECAKVISKAITSIPYKNRYYVSFSLKSDKSDNPLISFSA